MLRRHDISLSVASFLACLLVTAAVRGERSGGIGADLAVDEALRSLEAQNAHKLQLSSDLSALQEREATLHTPLRDHVRALYRVTRSGTAPVASGFEAMRSYLSRVRRLKTIVQGDIQRVASLHKQQTSTLAEAQQADRDLAAAQEQVDKLRTAASAPPPVAAVTRSRQSPDRSFYGLRLSENSSSVLTPFEALRGKLAAPLSGELRLHDVQRGESSALMIEAPAGATVRASAPGRVTWSDGHRIVIDHGGGYQTVYAQLGSVEVRSGDDVSGLARLGTVADGDEPALVFEVRRGARTLSPRTWLGL